MESRLGSSCQFCAVTYEADIFQDARGCYSRTVATGEVTSTRRQLYVLKRRSRHAAVGCRVVRCSSFNYFVGRKVWQYPWQDGFEFHPAFGHVVQPRWIGKPQPTSSNWMIQLYAVLLAPVRNSTMQMWGMIGHLISPRWLLEEV